MNLTIDLKNRYIHLGASPLEGIEDFINQGFYPYIQEDGFEALQRQIYSISVPAIHFCGSLWMRVSFPAFLQVDVALFAKNIGGNFCKKMTILNLETLQSGPAIGNAAQYHSRISSDGYMMRIDDEGGQRIFHRSQTFHLNSVRCMMIGPCHSFEIGPRKVLSCLALMIAFAIVIFGVEPLSFLFQPGSSRVQTESRKDSNPESEGSATKPQQPSILSIPVRSPENPPQKQPENAELPEASAEEAKPAKVQKVRQIEFDPMRCGPIKSKNREGKNLPNIMAHSPKEEWIVCR